MHLDRTNLQILDLLQANARTSISELARTVNRGESTVRERIASLERAGVLQGYRALVDPTKLGFNARALLRAACDPRAIPELGRRLEGIPNVTHAILTTGAKPVHIEVVTKDLGGLEELLEQRIAHLDLQQIETGIVLQNLLDPRPAPIQTLMPPAPVRPGSLDLEAALTRLDSGSEERRTRTWQTQRPEPATR